MCDTGNGYKQAKLNTTLKTWLQDMQSVLRLFCKDAGWMDASETIAVAKGRGPYYRRTLRHWIKSFITDGNSLPTNAWGSGNVSRLNTDDGLRDELRGHLQDRGTSEKMTNTYFTSYATLFTLFSLI